LANKFLRLHAQSSGWSNEREKLTYLPHLLLKLRTNGYLSLRPIHVFISWFTALELFLLLSTDLWSETSDKSSWQSAEKCHCWLTTNYCPNNRVTHVLLSVHCTHYLAACSLTAGSWVESWSSVCLGFVVDRVKWGTFILIGIRFYSTSHHSTKAPYLSIISSQWFDSQQCKIFLFSTASRLTLGATPPPIQWVPGALSPEIMWQRREADQSPPFSVESKKGGAVTPLPRMSSWHNAQLINHRDSFTFTRDRNNRSIGVQSTKEVSLTPYLNCLMRLNVFQWLVANMEPDCYNLSKTYLSVHNLRAGKPYGRKTPMFSMRSTLRRACGSVVGWGTMLQARRLPIRVPDEVDVFNWPNLSSRTISLRSTQPSSWGQNRPARRADNLATIYEPNVWKCGSLNLSQP
jgi:hypothetical protein